MRISRTLLDAIIAQARAVPDREICGLLFGDDESIAHAEEAANVHPDSARHFEVDPEALIRAHKAARGGGPQFIGAYHSHPSGAAAPSREDTESAEPGQLCLIVAGSDARLFRHVDGDFAPVELILDDGFPKGK